MTRTWVVLPFRVITLSLRLWLTYLVASAVENGLSAGARGKKNFQLSQHGRSQLLRWGKMIIVPLLSMHACSSRDMMLSNVLAFSPSLIFLFHPGFLPSTPTTWERNAFSLTLSLSLLENEGNLHKSQGFPRACPYCPEACFSPREILIDPDPTYTKPNSLAYAPCSTSSMQRLSRVNHMNWNKSC